jgi:IS5 family transposase
VPWHAKVRHYRPLIERIIAQTERRVLQGEAIPANDKIVSLFERRHHRQRRP